MTFQEQMVNLWQNIFEGENRLICYIGFCMLSFAVPFVLIWLYGGIIELYFYMVLRRRYPEEWESMRKTAKIKGINYYYKKWLKGEVDAVNPFCKIWRIHDLFGKIILGVWFVIALIVGVAALSLH